MLFGTMKRSRCERCGQPASLSWAIWEDVKASVLLLAPMWILADSMGSDELIKTLVALGCLGGVRGVQVAKRRHEGLPDNQG